MRCRANVVLALSLETPCCSGYREADSAGVMAEDGLLPEAGEAGGRPRHQRSHLVRPAITPHDMAGSGFAHAHAHAHSVVIY